MALEVSLILALALLEQDTLKLVCLPVKPLLIGFIISLNQACVRTGKHNGLQELIFNSGVLHSKFFATRLKTSRDNKRQEKQVGIN